MCSYKKKKCNLGYRNRPDMNDSAFIQIKAPICDPVLEVWQFAFLSMENRMNSNRMHHVIGIFS